MSDLATIVRLNNEAVRRFQKTMAKRTDSRGFTCACGKRFGTRGANSFHKRELHFQQHPECAAVLRKEGLTLEQVA